MLLWVHVCWQGHCPSSWHEIRAQRCQECGDLKSSKDTRYATDSVVARDGIKSPCWTSPDLLSFRDKYGYDAYQKLDAIGIDKAQFFRTYMSFGAKLLMKMLTACELCGKPKLLRGLFSNFKLFKLTPILSQLQMFKGHWKLASMLV
ncbi:unnamed protein product [Sphenostylis stenocarpa]|uniref:Thymidine kinase n=1 Tax=Sphenostylis stenocarpa TaxID=92480 RepID=A0AA86SVU2_9FABA|nr:unnamed protein product [Sphenostylis stenocarpa]